MENQVWLLSVFVIVFDKLVPLGSRFYLFIYHQLDNGTTHEVVPTRCCATSSGRTWYLDVLLA